jgi:hypothetical protein
MCDLRQLPRFCFLAPTPLSVMTVVAAQGRDAIVVMRSVIDPAGSFGRHGGGYFLQAYTGKSRKNPV